MRLLLFFYFFNAISSDFRIKNMHENKNLLKYIHLYIQLIDTFFFIFRLCAQNIEAIF